MDEPTPANDAFPPSASTLAPATPSLPLHQLPPEATFQALLESAPDSIVIVDASGRILAANNQVAHVFGYASKELIGHPIEVLLPERLRDGHIRHRMAYIQAPHTRPMGSGLELAARRKDGSEFPVEISLSAIRTEDGLLVTSIIRDVTERKRAEAALARQTAQLREQANLLNLAHDAIIVRDLASTVLFWNPGAEELYGWPRDAAVGQLTHGLLQTRSAQPLAEIDAVLFADGRWEGELTHTRRDGSEVVVASRQALQRDERGTPVAILEINHDITERKHVADLLAQQVRRHTAHLSALLQFSQELLTTRSLDAVLQRALSHALALVPDAQCGAIYLYDVAESHLGLRASVGFSRLPSLRLPTTSGTVGLAFTGRQTYVTSSQEDLAALVPEVSTTDVQRLQHLFDQPVPPSGTLAIPLVAHDQAIGVLLLLRKTGGGPFVAEARGTLEGLANLAAAAISEDRRAAEATTLSGRVADLEAQQRAMHERLSSAEVGMLQAARLAAVGQLAASVAHEINNPLYAVRNCLYLLEEDFADQLKGSQYMVMAREQLGRIARIIERMRDFYRPSRGDMAPHSLNRLLEETLALAELNMQHTAIKVFFAPAADLPEVLCNGDQLRQVFLNLILNAIDAMPSGGTLTVRTAAGPTVAVSEIQDTGIGMSPDTRARLFEPFFTNKPHGTGLGLSVSAHIVTQHGGQIEVDSREGHGSIFRIVLPYKPVT